MMAQARLFTTWLHVLKASTEVQYRRCRFTAQCSACDDEFWIISTTQGFALTKGQLEGWLLYRNFNRNGVQYSRHP